MKISKIEIENIKGISQKSFKMQIVACKPNLIVAPNGFGKSSIATAFSSMNSVRLKLDEKDCYMEDTSLEPKISLTIDGQILTADKNKNEIRSQYDVLVINSGLTPKAKKHFQGSVSSSLEVQSINVCKIPVKSDFSYMVTDLRSSFGFNGKVLPNIADLLKNNNLVDAIEGLKLSKFTQKGVQDGLNKVIDLINLQQGTAEKIANWIKNNHLNKINDVPLISELGNRLVKFNLVNSEVDGFLAAYQIATLYNSDPKSFNASINWLKYLKVKTNYQNLLLNFKSSNWQWAELKEDNSKKSLSVEFPNANQISNGQRDLITLLVHLHKTLYEGSKKPLILIIDEVFDYLDDANLVAFQYYVTSIIESYKERIQIIYPIILTHLDPGVFFDFCFNKHKIQVNYLLAKPIGKSKDTLRLIEARDTQDHIKEKLEAHWFHFHKKSCEISVNDWPNNLLASWHKSTVFHDYTLKELNRYLLGKNYDPLAVCFAVRVSIERLVYELLQQQNEKEEFLNQVRKTVNKLNFVARTRVEIPESYFLLGLIYNTNLHWNQGRDYVSPLTSKLSHPTIKHLIEDVSKRLSGF